MDQFVAAVNQVGGGLWMMLAVLAVLGFLLYDRPGRRSSRGKEQKMDIDRKPANPTQPVSDEIIAVITAALTSQGWVDAGTAIKVREM